MVIDNVNTTLTYYCWVFFSQKKGLPKLSLTHQANEFTVKAKQQKAIKVLVLKF